MILQARPHREHRCLDLRNALRGVLFVVLQPIEVLVPFAAVVAAVRFVFFHAEGAWIDFEGVRVDDGEGAVVIGGELLGIVAVLNCVRRWPSKQKDWNTYVLMVLQPILIFICLLAADDWAMERFWYAPIGGRVGHPRPFLLFPYCLCNLTVLAVLAVPQLRCGS